MEHMEFLTILHQAEKLKNNTRHSWTSSGRHESVAEHSFRLCIMAYFLQDEFPGIHMDTVLKMCLFHDMGEAFTGDIPSFNKTANDELAEEAAIENWLSNLPAPYQQELTGLFTQMKELNTPEAQFYKALDKLEVLIQHEESDISTWLPIEYELNFTYGTQEVKGLPYLEKLREILNTQFVQKIENSKEQNRR